MKYILDYSVIIWKLNTNDIIIYLKVSFYFRFFFFLKLKLVIQLSFEIQLGVFLKPELIIAFKFKMIPFIYNSDRWANLTLIVILYSIHTIRNFTEKPSDETNFYYYYLFNFFFCTYLYIKENITTVYSLIQLITIYNAYYIIYRYNI